MLEVADNSGARKLQHLPLAVQPATRWPGRCCDASVKEASPDGQVKKAR